MTKPKRIWLSPPHMSGRELKYVNEAFDENWIAPVGPHITAFEEALCSYNHIDHACVLSSGTAAIHLALIILGIAEGDEVICSSFTFSATINPVIYQKALPILIDSESDSWNMSPELLEIALKERIKTGKKPKAIILVHLYGQPANLAEIMAIANQYEVPVIEDAAESLGSTYDQRFTGTFGRIGIYSFNGNKIITTSGGGAMVSNNQSIIDQAKFLSTQARDQAPHYQHSQIGYNYRMSNVLAGIGRGQLEVLEDRIQKRREHFNFYKDALAGYDFIRFQSELTNSKSNRWLTALNIDAAGMNERIRIALDAENIESRPLWKPMHLQPVFKDHPSFQNGVSDRLFNNGLCLPSGSSLSKEDLERIVHHIKSVLDA